MEQIKNQNLIEFSNGKSIECNFVINCAGGNSLGIAKKFGLAKEYSNLHFRGEYWVIDQQYANLVNTNIYTVAKFSQFPFLDPHWIKRANGKTEIGPNAVPVPDSETYSGYVGSVSKSISKLGEILRGSSKKLLLNSEFLSLVSKEWKSSLSKNAMVSRVKEFIPKIKPEYFTTRSTAGIRTPIITKTGSFLSEMLEIQTDNSFHVINYNSPGATGALAYSAYLVQQLSEKGIIKLGQTTKPQLWSFEKIIK